MSNLIENTDKPTAVVASRRKFLAQMGVGSLVVGASAISLTGCDKHTATVADNGEKIGSGTTKTDMSKDNASQDNAPQDNAPNVNPAHAGDKAANVKNCLADNQFEFYGEHQSGITTPQQRSAYFLVADLHTTDLNEVKEVFKKWTEFSVKLMKGENIASYEGQNPHVPTVDTGEADSLGAYGLTLTFGISPSFLKKLNLTDKAPAEFTDLPAFPRDQIRPEYSGGDICIQACSDDPQVTFHAIRQLVRQARSSITMKWSQSGFLGYDSGNETARNLFAFKDGTANKETLKNSDKTIWIDKPDWLKGGSYLVVRLIQMHLETWDRTSLNGQNDTFGRYRLNGAPIGQKGEFDTLDPTAKDDKGQAVIPEDSHASLAKSTGMELLRRSYSYSSGIDPKTGQFDAGLLFIAFQKSPVQFITIQNMLGRIDVMNEYITHIGSGLFACFGGVKQGEYIGQKLFEG